VSKAVSETDGRTESAAQAFREDLIGLDDRLHFNHATRGPIPGRVLAAMRAALEADAARDLGRIGWKKLVDDTRSGAAALLGASAAEIAFVQNTSTGLSIAAAAIRWRPGDNVVVSLAENPANLAPWLHIAEYGVETRCAPTHEAKVDVGALLSLADEHTRVVAASAVEYASGQRVDLSRVGEFCRQRGIGFVVDAAQTIGAVPLNVKEAKIDILAVGASKWLMGPAGIGLMFVDNRLHDRLRTPLVGEHAVHPDADYTRCPDLAMRRGAMRFEAGMPNVCGIAGLAEALSVVEEIGIEAIAERLKQVTDHLAEGLADAGYHVISPRSVDAWSGIVSFDPGSESADDLVARLGEARITVAARRGYVRVSPHWYHTKSDVDRLLSLLHAGSGKCPQQAQDSSVSWHIAINLR